MNVAYEKHRWALGEIKDLLQGWPIPIYPTIFVPGRAEGDWEHGQSNDGLLTIAARLYHLHHYTHFQPTIVVPGHDGSYQKLPDGRSERMPHGYPGFSVWRAELLRCSVPTDRILPCIVPPGEEQTTHTRSETDGFVRQAIAQGWQDQSIVAIAHPHQLPRVLGCLYRSLELQQRHLLMIPHAPALIDWERNVYGSLGAQQLPRYQHITEENTRLWQYEREGWMMPLVEVRERLLADHAALRQDFFQPLSRDKGCLT